MSENIMRADYIIELGMIKSLYKQITAPQVSALGGRDMNGTNFSMGYSFITEPFLMVEEAHTHDFDQILWFLGGDPGNIGEFDAEVEMHLGNNQQKHIITYSACVHIPAGLMHCPLNIKKVTKPIMFFDITLSPGASIRPVPKASQ